MFDVFSFSNCIDTESFEDLKDAMLKFMSLIDQGKQLPAVLYHYTDTYGFHGILHQVCIRATHIMYLNDSQEYSHGVAIFRRVIEERLCSAEGDAANILDYLSEFVQPQYLRREAYPAIFVSCFSAKENDLSQWRAYGRGEGGIAIGFDPKKLNDSSKSKGMWLINVEYDLERKKELANNLLTITADVLDRYLTKRQFQTEEEKRKGVWEWFHAWRGFAALFGPVLKDDSFSDENEWRICAIPPKADMSQIEFLPKSRMLIPYYNLGLGVERKPLPDILPICNVWVGPGRDNDISIHSVRSILKKYRYEVEVNFSSIPFRVS